MTCVRADNAAAPHRPWYRGRFSCGHDHDVYDVLTAFRVTSHALAHAIKKLLAPGLRGAKDAHQDLDEAVASIRREQEMNKEVPKK